MISAYCIQQRFFREAGFFFFIRVVLKAQRNGVSFLSGSSLTSKKHHAVPRIGDKPNTYKKGLFSVFV